MNDGHCQIFVEIQIYFVFAIVFVSSHSSGMQEVSSRIWNRQWVFSVFQVWNSDGKRSITIFPQTFLPLPIISKYLCKKLVSWIRTSIIYMTLLAWNCEPWARSIGDRHWWYSWGVFFFPFCSSCVSSQYLCQYVHLHNMLFSNNLNVLIVIIFVNNEYWHSLEVLSSLITWCETHDDIYLCLRKHAMTFPRLLL